MRRVWRPGLLLGLAYLGYSGLAVRGGVLGIAWPSIRTDFDVSLDALGALAGSGGRPDRRRSEHLHDQSARAARDELAARLLGRAPPMSPFLMTAPRSSTSL